MLIHALDPGRLCGVALGPAGEMPNSGRITLRKNSEDRSVGCFNIESYLLQTWKYGKPDLLAYEPPMTIEAWIANARKSGKFHGGGGIQSASELSGCIMATCVAYGVPFVHIHRISMMSMITGKSGWGDPDVNKQKIIDGLLQMKMLDPGFKDDNEADAVAVHVVASKKYARVSPRNFGLFA